MCLCQFLLAASFCPLVWQLRNKKKNDCACECGLAQRGWGDVGICQNAVKNVTCTARQGEQRQQITERQSGSEVVREERRSAWFGTLFLQGKILYSPLSLFEWVAV